MASVVSIDGKWRAQIRRAGGLSLSKTFTLKKDAQLWAKQKELDLERGELPQDQTAALDGITLSDLVTRYRDMVTPKSPI